MKKILFFGLLFLAGWLGFAYFSAVWSRIQFTHEVDSLLESPREMTEANLPPLILNKARQAGIELRPDDIQVEITPGHQDTTTSRLLEGKGFAVETRTLTLHIRYSQSILGMARHHILDRERTFTSRITPLTRSPAELDEPLGR